MLCVAEDALKQMVGTVVVTVVVNSVVNSVVNGVVTVVMIAVAPSIEEKLSHRILQKHVQIAARSQFPINHHFAVATCRHSSKQALSLLNSRLSAFEMNMQYEQLAKSLARHLTEINPPGPDNAGP